MEKMCTIKTKTCTNLRLKATNEYHRQNLINFKLKNLKLQRLAVVRQKSKAHAKETLQIFRNEKNRLVSALKAKIIEEEHKLKNEKIYLLEKQYQHELSHIGDAHSSAKNASIENEIRRQKAGKIKLFCNMNNKERHMRALSLLKDLKRENNRPHEISHQLREKVKYMENNRAKNIANLPKSNIADIEHILKNVDAKPKIKIIDNHGNTYMHVPENSKFAISTHEDENANLLAGRENKNNEIEFQKVLETREKINEIALERHSKALKIERIRKNTNNLMELFKKHQTLYFNQKSKNISKLPKQLFLPQCQRKNLNMVKQQNMENLFEKNYRENTSHYADLNALRKETDFEDTEFSDEYLVTNNMEPLKDLSAESDLESTKFVKKSQNDISCLSESKFYDKYTHDSQHPETTYASSLSNGLHLSKPSIISNFSTKFNLASISSDSDSMSVVSSNVSTLVDSKIDNVINESLIHTGEKAIAQLSDRSFISTEMNYSDMFMYGVKTVDPFQDLNEFNELSLNQKNMTSSPTKHQVPPFLKNVPNLSSSIKMNSTAEDSYKKSFDNVVNKLQVCLEELHQSKSVLECDSTKYDSFSKSFYNSAQKAVAVNSERSLSLDINDTGSVLSMFNSARKAVALNSERSLSLDNNDTGSVLSMYNSARKAVAFNSERSLSLDNSHDNFDTSSIISRPDDNYWVHELDAKFHQLEVDISDEPDMTLVSISDTPISEMDESINSTLKPN
ncbi:hypothetical protein A3Q56_04544 [Intoshia linei]|uniref:Uncharacterized protein n=1 Tax=Intoshia linei TaxID=1819745 RepID=A0A177B0D0_9BILA|nr:hypothetical protein A3Q56_04544 [Intoshia linei]